eukprot:TRINITY_DN3450_c0_g1_i2.p1 TRINITY_DN3450_c0_g1~~TRINITY_DN3450_c0_g1_i2.p1  ORF type:complete len:306 (+),score=14.39 TRINITY_DN3450_c0_g1_i2:343-1260(+)
MVSQRALPTTSPPEIIRLNVGGQLFLTTKTTLIGRGENFFVPLVNGEFSTLKDETGAYFVDRNGSYFAPILDYLRNGTLIVPQGLKLESILQEASFYSIDVVPGLCGDIKEGLYTSPSWILFLERDLDQPWIFAVSGVEEKSKNVFFQEVCVVKDGVLQWRDNEIYSRLGKVFIRKTSVFKSKTQLFFRCSKSEKFPLNVAEILESDRTFENEPIWISFAPGPQGVQVRSGHPTHIESAKYGPIMAKAVVLCKSLLIMHTDRHGDWLLYLHSDLAFFTFNHPYLEFGDSFHLHMSSPQRASILPV